VKLLYPIKYVYAGIIHGQLRHGNEYWLAKIAAIIGTAIPVNFIVLGCLSGLFCLIEINIVVHWHFLAQKMGVPYVVIALIENMPIALLIIYYSCIKENRYASMYESIQASTDSQLMKTIKAISIAIGALLFSFLCMVLFL
jgi:hypothetical protein